MTRRPTKGFSLLELVLALGLATLVLALVGMATYSHLLQLTASRGEVEQAQLARGILAIIAADLRSATAGVEQDMAPLMGLATEQSQFDVDSVDQTAAGAGSKSDSEGASGSGEPASTSPTTTPTVTDPAKQFVGLTGGASAIEIDTVRPAMELAAVSADAASTSPPVARFASSLARVRYAVGPLGLVRSVAPVAKARWVVEQGLAPAFSANDPGTQTIDPTAVPWAAEVRALAFRYTDGEQLYPVWDPVERGALPRAVEVTIEVASGAAAEGTPPPGRIYRQWVALPAARELSDETAETDEAATDETAAGGST
jgi:hypothetical protein